MKIINGLILICIVLVFSSCNSKNETMTQRELSKEWKFRKVGDKEWMPATIPGTVHTNLLENGIIEDPFYRLKEHDLQWIDKVDWEYQSVFEISEEEWLKENLLLIFNGLDTYAQVYLNDSLLLESDNMFRTYHADCKKYAQIGANTILIKFASPIQNGIEKYDALNYEIPVSNNDLSEIGQVEGNKRVSIFTRKAGYHFGWDWGPRLVTSGIWRPIVLQSWDAFFINDLFVKQDFLGEIAKLTADIEVESKIDAKGLLVEIYANSELIKSSTINLHKGLNALSVPFNIENPELWWPNGLGDQNLYDIEVKLNHKSFISTESKRIGLRTVELITEPDSMGTSFYFSVNGEPVFMKGANYIPQDVFLTRVDTQHYEHILQSAADANMNMLRVWGGGIYENDLFYELCDELGLMVWQDFMFACAMFPGDSAFLDNVTQEAIDNVKRLRNHASIALWCGNNEILSAWEDWGWKNTEAEKQGKEVADVIWKAYDDIFHKILPSVVKEYDESRRYWPSSPGAAFGEKSELNRGDMHYWGVWWGKEPFANYETVMPRFMSEFGFQSFPEMESVKKYTLPEDYDIYSDVMKSHQRSTIGNGTIEEYMLRDYKKPKDFESFLYVSHLLQADGIGFAIEAQRRNRHRCMGSLYWQINDCWPVASWASIDYYGKWKALHFRVRDAFEPVILSFNDEDAQVKVYMVSDLLQPFEGQLKLKLMDFDGNVLESWEKSIKVAPNQAQVYMELEKAQLFNKYDKREVLLVGEFSKIGSLIHRNVLFFVPNKDVDFPQPNLSYTVSENESQFIIHLKTEKLARSVYLSTPMDGNFSDNYMDMLPGAELNVTIEKIDGISIDEFKAMLKVKTLIDAY